MRISDWSSDVCSSDLGVPFNAGEDFAERWHLTREGGHSHRRIVHVDDATGAAVQQALTRAAEGNPNITMMPDMVAIDLITSRHGEQYSGDGHVWGVHAFNKATNHADAYVGRTTIQIGRLSCRERGGRYV